ncbi:MULTISPECIES: helix-turn-helix domain-containing protein [unclassified Streptomyces]|uniref:ArsR/SmtB family transcription factor n=1 Tax=unclassified Streptomyces TaxID=2593676 RepID=UPI00036E88C0|nr:MULTISPECIES: helix-turn-helix domain-containing protein [unclassified Streptomyces]MYT28016.1 helix-turn-helix domain-containing protein [Streptomyces sp. SID8354]
MPRTDPAGALGADPASRPPAAEPAATSAPADPDQPETARIRLGDLLQAFSDPLRRRIVHRLATEGEAGCGDIELPVSRATGSYHFRILRTAGWTHTRRSGRERYVSLRRADLEERFPGLVEALLRADAAERDAAAEPAGAPESA